MTRGARSAFPLLCLILLGAAWAGAAAAETACPASMDGIAHAVDRPDANVSLGSQAMTKVLPAGNSIDILVDTKFDPQLTFAGLIDWTGNGNAAAAYVPPNAIWSHELPANHAFVANGQNSFAMGKTLLSFQLPRTFQSLGREVTITLLGCKDVAGYRLIVARIQARTSWFWFCVGMAVFSVLAAYLIAMLAVSAQRQVPLWHSLSALRLTAGWDRRGSPAKMQVMLFTLIVIGLLTFILCRAGFLSNMSTDIMALLGISTGGAVIARATDMQKNRMSSDNWCWLKRRGLVDPVAIAQARQPRWSDLFMIQDEFDVSRFQIVLFSLLVGAALIVIGLNDLATFSVPDSLLGLLGVSQATYILGKSTAQNYAAALDQSVKKLRDIAEPSPAKAAVWDAGTATAGDTSYVQAVEDLESLFYQVYGVPMKPRPAAGPSPS